MKRNGVILNWNNKPAPGWAAADDEWSFGSVYRVELFEDAIAGAPQAHAREPRRAS